VWAIGNRTDDGRDGWQPSLKGAAGRLGMPFSQPPSINHGEFIERLAAFSPDRLISIQYDQILKGALFAKIGAPCLNLHFSLLPRHRGVAPIAWAILSGDDEAGATLHHMVEGIDEGDVIAGQRVRILPDDTARALYDKVSDAAISLFEKSYPFSPALLERRMPQTAGMASYHRAGDFDFSQRRVDWKQPAENLQRWIRAMIFPPLQYPEVSLEGQTFYVTRIAETMGRPGTHAPGTVVSRTGQRLEVAAADGTIRITGMEKPSAPSQAPRGLPASVAMGARFD